MLDAWLNSSDWVIFSTLIVGFGAIVVLIRTLSFSRWTKATATSFVGVAPSYFSALAVLLALLTGFVANDTWERQRQATRAVQAEGEEIRAVDALSAALPADTAKIRAALRAYVGALVEDEWPRMAENRPATRADQAWAALIVAASAPQGADARPAVQSALIAAVLRIGTQRGDRLSINEHETDGSKWISLLILGVLTQMSIGVVHLERLRAQLAALLIFTVGLVSALGLIAIHEWPFQGPASVTPEPIVAALHRNAP